MLSGRSRWRSARAIATSANPAATKQSTGPVIRPTPSADLAVNRKDFNVFGLFGSTSRVLKLEAAIRTVPGVKLDSDYHPGVVIDRNGLTDFPYDYDRLFNYRAIVLNNSVFDIARSVGMSILIN